MDTYEVLRNPLGRVPVAQPHRRVDAGVSLAPVKDIEQGEFTAMRLLGNRIPVPDAGHDRLVGQLQDELCRRLKDNNGGMKKYVPGQRARAKDAAGGGIV